MDVGLATWWSVAWKSLGPWSGSQVKEDEERRGLGSMFSRL